MVERIETQKTPQDLQKLSVLLDSKYEVLGFRVGWDGILGFIPYFGDFVSSGLSFYIIYRAALLGCSPSVILRMGLNLIIDNFVSSVPIIGHVFDFMWKSNNKNIALIESYALNPSGTRNSARFVVILALILVAAGLIGTVILAIWLFTQLVHLLQSSGSNWS